MTTPPRLFVAIGVFSLLVVAIVVIKHRTIATPVALPEGKVEPYLRHNLLLAPNGTLWKLEHSGKGGRASLTLVPFAPGCDWKQVSGWSEAGLAIKQDGTLWSWGTPSSATVASPPVQIGSDVDWTCARVGGLALSPLALKSDGTLWSFGHTHADSKIVFTGFADGMVPVQLGSDRDWKTVEAGMNVYCALKNDGTLWHWGWLSHLRPTRAPSRVSPDTDWRSTAGSGGTLVAFKGEGSIWLLEPSRGCGVDYPPSLDGWRPISMENDWRGVASGFGSIIAKHADGSWRVSGDNSHACLGIPRRFGDRSEIEHPTRLNIDLDVWVWSLGTSTTLLLARDGSFYYMGRTPEHSAASRLNKLKEFVNHTFVRFGTFPPFETDGSPFSHKPVKIGELPSTVISALKSAQ